LEVGKKCEVEGRVQKACEFGEGGREEKNRNFGASLSLSCGLL